MKTTAGYNSAQIALHWLIAAGIFFNWFVSGGMGRALNQRIEGTEISVGIAGLHVWIGVAVFLMAIARIVLRLVRGGPAAQPGALGKAAHAVHGILYLLILLMPFAGMMAWFGGVEAAGGAHKLMANLLVLVAVLHAAAALFHQFVLKDGTLRRMVKPA